MPGVYKEQWEREVVKQLTHEDQGGFLDGIPDKSQYVSAAGDEYQVIHMTLLGVGPQVLTNQNTYPIAISAQGETDVPIQLHKHQTTATPITDDELYALSYDKMTAVKDSHATAITERKLDMAVHALAPTQNTATTPVLKTTGASDATHKALTRADIIRLKKAFDDNKIPTSGRRLVLSPEHVADLLLIDQKFADQYYNYTPGKIGNLYGFEVYEYVNCPVFATTGSYAKKSFGSVPAGTDRMASVAFHVKRAAKAFGWTKMYFSEAKTDPLNQRNLINFRHNAIVLPLEQKAIGAIVSDTP